MQKASTKRHPKRSQSAKKSRRKKRATTQGTIPPTQGAQPEPIGFNQPPRDDHGFVGLILQRVGWDRLTELNARKSPRGRPAQVLSRAQLLVGIIFHYTLSCAGTFAEHLMILTGISMAESSISERRQALPQTVFEQLLALILRPIAKVAEAAYYKGLRLVAIDGVAYSVGNHAPVNKRLAKVKNQKGKGGFAKLRCAVLVELLMHNPLAARLGCEGESEWRLAQGLLEHLPARSLLMADRLYGCGAFILTALEVLTKLKGHLLLRVKENLKVLRVLECLCDGSKLVEIKAMNPENHHEVAGKTIVREIRATLRRKGCRPLQVRYWTTLTDEKQYPAQELVRLYMSRWEHELYFRELKHELGTNDLLRSQTVETAAQELAAMIIGSSIIAEERSKLKAGDGLPHRLSFIKVWDLLEPLWLTLLLGADILTGDQKQRLADRFYHMASRCKMPKRRIRSCPRVLRQPQQPWPKKRQQKEHNSPVACRIAKR